MMDRERTLQEFPTLQSIQAQSEVSVDLKQNELQPLISQIFMLCVELERKEFIFQIRQQETRQIHHERTVYFQNALKQFKLKCNGLEEQTRDLWKKNEILRSEKQLLQRQKVDLQIYKQRSSFNQQLQKRASALQIHLKNVEEKRIQDQILIENLKRQKSMLAFDANKTVERNRIKDLQFDLQQQKSKLEAEKKITAQLKFQMQKSLKQLNETKYSEISSIKRQCEEVMKKFQITKEQQFLKQSRVTIDHQNKLALISQENYRLQTEIEYLRGLLRAQQNKVKEKQQECKKIQLNLRSLEEQLKNKQKNQSASQNQFFKKQKEMLFQIQILQNTIKTMKTKHDDMESYISQKSMHEQQYQRQFQRIQLQLQASEKSNSNLKSELRKLKRKSIDNPSQCQVCKIRSSTTLIQSSKSIFDKLKPTDLQEIIRETQKLNMSNKKIDNLINHHEMASQHSIQMRTSSYHVVNLGAESR